MHNPNCSEISSAIEQLRPDLPAQYVARMCLLLAQAHSNGAIAELLEDTKKLQDALDVLNLQYAIVTDQHAGMTEDLEQMTKTCTSEGFTLDQVWTLIRAIKVQSHTLQLFVGKPDDS